MKLLFDQNVPKKLKTRLPGHLVRTAWQEGWSTLQNGNLLRMAERNGFDVMITADQNIAYQQNNLDRRIALIVLGTTKWLLVERFATEIAAAIARSESGTYEYVAILQDNITISKPRGSSS